MIRHQMVLCAFMCLSACLGDPFAGVPRLSEVEFAEDAPRADALADPAKTADTPILATSGDTDAVAGADPGSPASGPPLSIETAAAIPRRGLFGFLRGRAAAPPVQAAPADLALAGEAEIVPASAEPSVPPVPDADRGRRGGLGSLFARAPQAGAAGPPDGDPGPLQAVCALKGAALGAEVARKGKARLYDSDPASTALRPHYVTGFADGCPRRIDAAMAVFGSAVLRDKLSQMSKTRGGSPTEAAYRKLKAQVCGVRADAACSAAALDRIERETVFLTVYDRFGNNPGWGDILIHKGRVLAADRSGF